MLNPSENFSCLFICLLSHLTTVSFVVLIQGHRKYLSWNGIVLNKHFEKDDGIVLNKCFGKSDD